MDGQAGRTTKITHIVDVDSKRAGSNAESIGKNQDGMVPKVIDDVRRVLDDKTVDIITIATPNHWHSLPAIWAMQAGKDVYVEKPVSHNVSEGRRVVEAARKYEQDLPDRHAMPQQSRHAGRDRRSSTPARSAR